MNDLKPIPGYPDYFASKDGTIWTQKRKGGNDRRAGQTLLEPRPLKAHSTKTGYMIVTFDLNGKVVTKQVHRLILETFVGPAPEGYAACHYPDPTKSNNSLENLRWGSVSDNAKDKYRDRPKTDEKKCHTCQTVKPNGEFYKDQRAVDGLKTECKDCHVKTSIATRDRDKKNAANREYMRRKRDAR